MDEQKDEGTPRPGEADTPREAHDKTAPTVRRLRHGDDVPQSDG